MLALIVLHQYVKALDDAIAWRRARITAPCPDCEPGPDGRRCDDHACDVDLIVAYTQMFNATIQKQLRRGDQRTVGSSIV
jgi:hypothetical protein